MRQIAKWRTLQAVYMPGAVADLLQTSEDDAEDGSIEAAEKVLLLLPSSLDAGMRTRVCLQQVAEHERLLRIAQLQDSLVELRHARKVRRRLLVNHHTQIAGQGQRANTRSRTVMNSVENRITKFVARYRASYQALLELDPAGDWQEMFLELKDGDNRGPGKEPNEEGVSDGSYFRSWIWLSNPRVFDPANDEAGEEGASEEDVYEILRAEWTTSFARLERWTEEVELLQEEMRRVVVFLEWRSSDWLAKAGVRKGNTVSDVQSGLDAYARKQAAIHHDLAVSFTRLWRPTLVSYGLQHSWVTRYMIEHGVSLAVPVSRAQGIFKFRISGKFQDPMNVSRDPTDKFHNITNVSCDPTPTLSDLPTAEETTGNYLLLEEADDSEDSGLEDASSDSDLDLDDDLDS